MIPPEVHETTHAFTTARLTVFLAATIAAIYSVMANLKQKNMRLDNFTLVINRVMYTNIA